VDILTAALFRLREAAQIKIRGEKMAVLCCLEILKRGPSPALISLQGYPSRTFIKI
jgi:hypothetical protein